MISTHILDTGKGTPAGNIRVTLQELNGDKWKDVGTGVTSSDGRHAFETKPKSATYRIQFDVETPFFRMIAVTFKVEEPEKKYHVPLLLSPYGYSTYRGS